MSIDIDWDGVKSLIRWEPQNKCICCNLKLRKVTNKRCPICNFSPASSERKTNPNFFTNGYKPKAIFKKYGVPDSWGKCQLFYFMFHPELNNEYPYPSYIIDIFGDRINQNDIKWELHHENNQNWDDNIYNLMLCLKHEHSHFESTDNTFHKNIINLYERMGIIKQ